MGALSAPALLANAMPAEDYPLASTSQKPTVCSSITRGQIMSFAIPANESGRLEALRRYEILNTSPEVAYDEITELAAQICGCPVAVIGVVDEGPDWKKSKDGRAANLTRLPRGSSVCPPHNLAGQLFALREPTQDERVSGKPTGTRR